MVVVLAVAVVSTWEESAGVLMAAASVLVAWLVEAASGVAELALATRA